MYESYTDNIPLKRTSFIYTSVSGREVENVPWRQDAAFLEGRTDALRRKKWWLRVGWPVGALGAATLAAIALTINGIVLIWIYNTFKFEHGVAEVFAGDCHGSETINTWVHLGINAVSTMLLSGSNYCMQILSAPTRKEVDKAHAKQKWLDIGVPSVRNLKSVAWSKILMWWLLGLSSIPLHLMYNSVFFSTLATNEYKLVFANETFVEGGPNSAYDKKRFKRIEDIQAQVKTWDRLENAACINAYATEFLSTRRDLVVVVVDDEVTENASVKRVEDYLFDFNQDFPGEFDPYGWICDSNDGITLYGFTQKENEREYHCSAKVSKVKANANRWRFDKWDIEYCLSEPVKTKCSLKFSLPIIVVVMTCNVGKALIMFYVAFRVRDKPLITVGDAINSFLSDNDPSTAGMCLANKESIKAAAEPITYCENPRDFTYENPYLRWKWEKLSLNWEPGPTVYKSSVKRWSKATSSSRWWSCMVLFFLCMVVVVSFLAAGIVNANANNGVEYSLRGFMDLGIGTVKPSTTISGWKLATIGGSQVIASVLIANIPQPILSFVYLLFNGVFTSMFLADEWSHFAHERKSLRVSDPKPGQRATYFLQLPYRYAIPLMILSGVLHWSVSQSIFIAQVSSFRRDGSLKDPAAISTCGYSPIAIMLTMVIGSCLTVFMVVLGLRRYKPGMPMVGSCSAAISAACHGRLDIDTTAPLQWGVTSEEGEGVGHCAFSDSEVRMPMEGAMYAGWRKRS